jgi:hypothetical protein
VFPHPVVVVVIGVVSEFEEAQETAHRPKFVIVH